MATEYVIVSTPDVITVVSEGTQGPTGPQGQPGDNDSPSFTGSVLFTLLGTENVRIDARTNPRTLTLGVFRIEHTAGADGTRPVTLDIDANGFGATHAIVLDYKATGLTSGDDAHLIEVNVDTADSINGDIEVITVAKSGTGTSAITVIEAYPGVAPIKQRVGDPVYLTQAWKTTLGVYSDTTTAFSNGSDTQIFTNDNDYIYCGADTKFNQLQVYLVIKASNTIQAVFEYYNGSAWTMFSPSDGTNGFTVNGNIMWDINLSGWVTVPVNDVSKYYIRIQRTRNALTTPPTEATILVIASTGFGWDANADISIRKARASGLLTYADRAAAEAGGLTTGQFYQTSAGVLMIV